MNIIIKNAEQISIMREGGKIHAKILNALQQGEITEERLAHSVKKILYAKYKVGLHNHKPVSTKNLVNDLNSRYDDIVYSEAIENAITVTKNNNNVIPVTNIDQKKIENLHKGIIPIYEPGLEKMVLKNIEKKNLFFTTKLEQAIADVEIVFIAVGTPMGDDGAADLQYVLSVAKEIGSTMTKRLVIVDKSTVPVPQVSPPVTLVIKASQNGSTVNR